MSRIQITLMLNLFFCLAPSMAFAATVEKLSYETLMADADIVVVARALEPRVVDPGDISLTVPEKFRHVIEVTCTPFLVRGSLKGNASLSEVALEHFQVSSNIKKLTASPRVPKFRCTTETFRGQGWARRFNLNTCFF